MMESLFGCANQNKNERRKDSPSVDTSVQYIQIIDPKKAQNLSILLRALNVTTEEVIDALKEGNFQISVRNYIRIAYCNTNLLK